MGRIEDRRELLHSELEEILGSSNVYYQPPGSISTKMQYPCIRYTEDRGVQRFADNKTYHYIQGYQLMYIDPNPISDMKERLLDHFSNITYNRHYIANNLNHDVFVIFY